MVSAALEEWRERKQILRDLLHGTGITYQQLGDEAGRDDSVAWRFVCRDSVPDSESVQIYFSALIRIAKGMHPDVMEGVNAVAKLFGYDFNNGE